LFSTLKNPPFPLAQSDDNDDDNDDNNDNDDNDDNDDNNDNNDNNKNLNLSFGEHPYINHTYC